MCLREKCKFRLNGLWRLEMKNFVELLYGFVIHRGSWVMRADFKQVVRNAERRVKEGGKGD